MKHVWWIVGFCLLSLSANASLVSRAGGQAYYDTVLNITWVADANLARSSGYDADGLMTWSQARGWIGSLNAANYLGADDWRLPTILDTGAPGCASVAYSGTDCGFNVQTISGAAVYSEMAHLFYSTLGNVGYYDIGGVLTGCSAVPTTICLSNGGPFVNLDPVVYWSGAEYAPDAGQAWRFGFHSGYQYPELKGTSLYAWAVRSGDIAAAPHANCPAGVSTPDSDGDGVPDLCDNCTLIPNPTQSDSDGDGYGNHCDGDLNNNDFTNAQDNTLFRAQLGQPSVAPTYNKADLNSNGFVNAQDNTVFRQLLGKPPGPSGRRGEVTAFQATPGSGSTKRVPVVLINFIPTLDGVHINSDLWQGRPWGLPSEWGNSLLIGDVHSYISDITSRVKFALEEGSRFRGYKTPSAQPYLGYQVVAVFNFYNEMYRGPLYPGSTTVYSPDLQEIMARIPAKQLVETQGVKEFWVNVYEMYGPGEIGFAESNMSSPLTGDVSNSHRIQDDLPVFSKTYVMYGTNYFRTQAEATHNHGHQIEAMLTDVVNAQDGNSTLLWKQFVGQNQQGDFITGRCGWTHMPPNTTGNYDYYNPTSVLSDCEDWRPDGTGQQSLVNANTWLNKAYSWPTPVPFPQQGESQFYIYWMQNMPGAGNQIPYGTTTMENWWDIVGDWDQAILSGKGLHR